MHTLIYTYVDGTVCQHSKEISIGDLMCVENGELQILFLSLESGVYELSDDKSVPLTEVVNGRLVHLFPIPRTKQLIDCAIVYNIPE